MGVVWSGCGGVIADTQCGTGPGHPSRGAYAAVRYHSAAAAGLPSTGGGLAWCGAAVRVLAKCGVCWSVAFVFYQAQDTCSTE